MISTQSTIVVEIFCSFVQKVLASTWYHPLFWSRWLQIDHFLDNYSPNASEYWFLRNRFRTITNMTKWNVSFWIRWKSEEADFWVWTITIRAVNCWTPRVCFSFNLVLVFFSDETKSSTSAIIEQNKKSTCQTIKLHFKPKTTDICIAWFKEIPHGSERKGRWPLAGFLVGVYYSYSTTCIVFTMKYGKHCNL
jgi:hypothetical protein